jgi:hypothetical protein
MVRRTDPFFVDVATATLACLRKLAKAGEHRIFDGAMHNGDVLALVEREGLINTDGRLKVIMSPFVSAHPNAFIINLVVEARCI